MTEVRWIPFFCYGEYPVVVEEHEAEGEEPKLPTDEIKCPPRVEDVTEVTVCPPPEKY